MAECDPVKIVREVIEEVSGIYGGRFEVEAANITFEADPVGLRRVRGRGDPATPGLPASGPGW